MSEDDADLLEEYGADTELFFTEFDDRWDYDEMEVERAWAQ